MDTSLYQQMRCLEDRHWWFKGRRQIASVFLQRAALPANAKMLDLGCGTGGNFAMLSQYGDVVGAELDEQAAKMAHDRGTAPVFRAKLPTGMPLEKASFHCITMFDVLEHIEDDHATLQSVNGLLLPDGYLLLTVPAFPFLWGPHDEAHHHKRRYRKNGLRDLLVDSGFEIVHLSYYSSWLFPVVVVVRILRRLLSRIIPAGHAGIELTIPPAPFNTILAKLFASERFILPYLNIPFGVSLIAVVKKSLK